jgi:hypothetical protein
MGWKVGWVGGDSEYGRSDLGPGGSRPWILFTSGAQGGLGVLIGRRGKGVWGGPTDRRGFQPALAPNTGLLSIRTKQQLTLELLARSAV